MGLSTVSFQNENTDDSLRKLSENRILSKSKISYNLRKSSEISQYQVLNKFKVIERRRNLTNTQDRPDELEESKMNDNIVKTCDVNIKAYR